MLDSIIEKQCTKSMCGSDNPFYGRKHTEETRAKLRQAALNRVVSEETKRKISEAHKGSRNNFFGKHHTEESKQRISSAKQGCKPTRLGATHKPESIVKMSQVKMGNRYSLGHTMPQESKAKLSRERTGRKWSAESRRKMSLTYKQKWQDEEYSNRTIEKSHLGMSKHPNKPESLLTELLNELYPSQFRFVGDNKEFRFGRKNPDFIDERNRLIVEMFGIYPHGQKAKVYEATEEGRIAHFAKFGFKTLVIWDVELYNQRDIVINRIRQFVG